jgi:hypothetical protein
MKRITGSEPVGRAAGEGTDVRASSVVTRPAAARRTPSAPAKTWISGDRIHDGGFEIWPDCQD